MAAGGEWGRSPGCLHLSDELLLLLANIKCQKEKYRGGGGDAKEADLYASEQKGSPRQPLASGRLRRGAGSLEVSQGWGDRCMWLERCSVRAEVG